MPPRRFASHRPLLAALAAAVGMLGAGPLLASTAEPSTKGEAELARLLAGRVAGEPVECLRPARDWPSRTIDGTAIVYGRGDTIYVQRTQTPAAIDRDSYLVTHPGQPARFCRMDQFTTIDRLSGVAMGALVFDSFIPYHRAKPPR